MLQLFLCLILISYSFPANQRGAAVPASLEKIQARRQPLYIHYWATLTPGYVKVVVVTCLWPWSFQTAPTNPREVRTWPDPIHSPKSHASASAVPKASGRGHPIGARVSLDRPHLCSAPDPTTFNLFWANSGHTWLLPIRHDSQAFRGTGTPEKLKVGPRASRAAPSSFFSCLPPF